jgi:threonine dehydratase
MISLKNIRDARKALAPFITSTPLTRSQFLSDFCGAEVFLKLENLQITHSFKIRGAFNKMLHLSLEEKTRGIVTASAGNHGQAVAFAARKLNFPAKIVIPESTPKMKIDDIKKFGVDPILFGDTYDEAEQKAKDLARKDRHVFVSPYNDELIIAGHGTIGLEIIEALPNVDTVIVPVGGGGLISGISIALKSIKPNVQIIGVQSAASPVMYESLKAGKIVAPQKSETKTIAEGLSGGIEKDSVTFKIIQECVDKIMLVNEETIRRAVYLLWSNEKQVVEGSGAAAIAPMMEKRHLFGGKTAVAVITGGNIEDELFQDILASEHYTLQGLRRSE